MQKAYTEHPIENMCGEEVGQRLQARPPTSLGSALPSAISRGQVWKAKVKEAYKSLFMRSEIDSDLTP